ncbi:hypothetical protein TruAng_010747 [Truncatella angustata]|nr:hypothetical protein TruAng_010747 [Truncatella angustata]
MYYESSLLMASNMRPIEEQPLLIRQRQRKFHRRSRNVPIAREKDSFVVYRALSNPGFLHAALLMTTLQWAWSTGDSEQFRVPYLYHKLQAIRFVNEQLAESETAVDDGTIAAITSLALVENCLGSADAVAFHLRGLIRIKDLQRKVAGKRPMGLLQRLILITESLMQKGQYSQTLWFWTVMFGASATVAAKTTSSLEENQMKATKDSYMDKINLASQLLKIKSWEGAKSTMQLFAWEDGFDGEEELKTLWEEAVWADGSRRPKLPLV